MMCNEVVENESERGWGEVWVSSGGGLTCDV